MAIESSYIYSVTSYRFSGENGHGKFPTFYNADAYCNYSLTTRDDNVSGSTTGRYGFCTTADFSYSITSYNSYGKVFDLNASQITFSATYSYNATISNVSWPKISKSTSTTISDYANGSLTFPMTVASSSSDSAIYLTRSSTISFRLTTYYTYTADEISWSISTSTAENTYVTSMISDLPVNSTSMRTGYQYDVNNVTYKTSYYSIWNPVGFTISSSSSYNTFYISDVGQLVSSSSTVSTQLIGSTIHNYISEYSTYTITSGNFSASFGSFITKSNEIRPVIESTYTSLDIAETVKDKDNYTYRTSFYGTIEKLVSEVSSTVKSDTSWLNVAEVQCISYTDLGQDYISLTAGTTVNRSSWFGVLGYDVIETYAGSTVTSQLNNPIYLTATVLSSSSFITTSEIKEGPFNTSFTTSVTKSDIYENRTLKDVAAMVRAPGYDTVTVINTTFSSFIGPRYDTVSSSSSTINTMDYGTTARISDMTGSSSGANVFNTYLVNSYSFSYNISSIWIYSTITSTLSEYSTVLVTQFSKSYNQGVEYTSVSYTQSSSTTALDSDDRYINKNAISRYDTNIISYTNTVAYYNGQTMATLNQSSMTTTYSSRTSTSRLTYTFISDKKDFSSSQSVITTDTMSSARQKFINSVSSVVNSTSEQQNDTLIFQSTVATISTYNVSSSYSTVSTMQIDYNATTYVSEYNPATYSISSTKVSTSVDVGTTVSSTSGTVQVTQSIGYTPVYSTVDGIYVTSN